MSTGPGVIRFADFELDPEGFELRRAGVRVDVQPRVLAVLAHLAAHPDELVTKEALALAVWRGQDASDEVIARAVMKARRALGEDAQAPRHIVTEAGKGFRFRGVVAEGPASSDVAAAPAAVMPPAPAPAVSWRVLPVLNRSVDPSLDWVVTGLQRMLCHVMERSAPGRAVSAEPLGGVGSDDTGLPSGRVVRAAAGRPKEHWVAAEVDRTAAGYRLDLAWLGAGDAIATASFEDPSLPALALKAAEQLLPSAPWQRELAERHPKAWTHLHETMSQRFRWPRDEAAQRLQAAFARLPPQVPLLLQQAELLASMDAFEPAEAAAARAAALLGEATTADPDLVLQARLQLARVAVRQGDLAEGRRRVQVCTDVAEARRPLATLLMVRLHNVMAYLCRENGDFEGARDACERGALHALRGGLVQLELRMRIWGCQVLNWLGQPHRAQDQLRLLLARALELGENSVASAAQLILGAIANEHGRFDDGVRWVERALAVALPVEADSADAENARSLLAGALIHRGDLDRAEEVLYWRRRDADTSTITQIGLLSDEAGLRWRQGRLAEAAAIYERIVADDRIDGWVKWAIDLRSSHARLLALMGCHDAARAALPQAVPEALANSMRRSRAAVALAAGARDEAYAELQAQARAASPGAASAYRALLDLAWLHLEDGRDFEAEELLDRVIAMEAGPVEREWLVLALQDRIAPVDPQAWEALRAKSPSLLRHCPALGTPEDVQARREGRAPPLPNLLTVLAW